MLLVVPVVISLHLSPSKVMATKPQVGTLLILILPKIFTIDVNA
jgi:hypothetical protein